MAVTTRSAIQAMDYQLESPQLRPCILKLQQMLRQPRVGKITPYLQAASSHSLLRDPTNDSPSFLLSPDPLAELKKRLRAAADWTPRLNLF